MNIQTYLMVTLVTVVACEIDSTSLTSITYGIYEHLIQYHNRLENLPENVRSILEKMQWSSQLQDIHTQLLALNGQLAGLAHILEDQKIKSLSRKQENPVDHKSM